VAVGPFDGIIGAPPDASSPEVPPLAGSGVNAVPSSVAPQATEKEQHKAATLSLERFIGGTSKVRPRLAARVSMFSTYNGGRLDTGSG
jgi:hypothetical protein